MSGKKMHVNLKRVNLKRVISAFGYRRDTLSIIPKFFWTALMSRTFVLPPTRKAARHGVTKKTPMENLCWEIGENRRPKYCAARLKLFLTHYLRRVRQTVGMAARRSEGRNYDRGRIRIRRIDCEACDGA